MWCEMTAAGSQNPVLLLDKMFSRKYIPSQNFRHEYQPQMLHKRKNKPRIYDFVKKKKKTRRKMKTHSFISYLGWCSTGFICTTKPSAAFLCGGGYTSKRKANWTTAACLATKSRIENQSCCCWESWRHGSFYRRKKRKQRDWSRSPFPSQSLGHCPASQDPPGTGPVSTNEDYFRCKSGWRRRYFWSPLLLHFWSPLRLPNCY